MVFDNKNISPEVFAQLFADYGEILTTVEVAEVLRMPTLHVAAWLREGTIRGFQLRRQWRIVKRELCEDLAAMSNRGELDDPDESDDAPTRRH